MYWFVGRGNNKIKIILLLFSLFLKKYQSVFISTDKLENNGKYTLVINGKEISMIAVSSITNTGSNSFGVMPFGMDIEREEDNCCNG